MTDLEIIKRCARAMGLEICFVNKEDQEISVVGQDGFDCLYDPLHDDAQAMALVKKFRLDIGDNGHDWEVYRMGQNDPDARGITFNADLNRAICECVARLQEAHGK